MTTTETMRPPSSTAMLGDLCVFEKGVYPTLKTEPGPYPLVVTAAFRRTADSFQIDGPTVCIPLISSTGHGDAALHRIHYQEGKFALANLLVALKPKPQAGINAKYLYYYLSAKKENLLVPLMRGTANVSLKEKDIAMVSVSHPSMDEQRRIVAKIDRLSTKIDRAHRLKEEICESARSMLLSEFRNITKTVRTIRMDKAAPLVRRPVEINIDEEYPELGVRSFGNGTFHKPSLAGIDVGKKKLYRIRSGDLIFNNVFAWEGAVAVAKEEDDGRMGSHRFIVRVPNHELITAPFLRFFFLTARGLELLGEASPGGAGRNRTLGLKKLDIIEVPAPPLSIQKRFDSLQANVDRLKALQKKTAAELDALLPSILDKAFKGDL